MKYLQQSSLVNNHIPCCRAALCQPCPRSLHSWPTHMIMQNMVVWQISTGVVVAVFAANHAVTEYMPCELSRRSSSRSRSQATAAAAQVCVWGGRRGRVGEQSSARSLAQLTREPQHAG